MRTQKYFLFCPGPVNISQNVKDATQHEIGHREVEFSALVKSINKKLLALYEIQQPALYQPVLITGSGTAANEAVLSSVIGNKNILVVSNGEFGERLYEISKLHNPNTLNLKFPWAREIDILKLENFIKQNGINAIAMVHHETSTGMLNPIKKVGNIAKKYNLTFIVDTISSVGAEKIDIEKCNITFCVGTAGKAIGSLPGVAFVIAKKKDFEKIKNMPPKTMYLNLYKFYEYARSMAQTPNTPAVQLFFSFEQALDNIITEGIEKRRKHIKNVTGLLRYGLKEFNLSFIIEEDHMSNVLTTVRIPNYINCETLKSKLREKNIIIYNGKGPLLNKVFQVGNIGAIDKDNVDYFLSNLGEILVESKKKSRSQTKLKNINSNQEIQMIGF